MDEQIIELGGNIFKEKSRYRFVLDLPFFNDRSIYYLTRDRISGKPFNLIKLNKGKKWYSLTWVAHLEMYLLRELKFIRYEETFDIKYEWKHRKELQRKLRRIKKNSSS